MPTASPTASLTPVVAIGAGTFQMGSPSNESGRDSDETLHQVTLTRDFLMQATEVTQAQWQALMGNNPSNFTGDSSRPVEQVSWDDAVAYANALSVADGLPKAYDLSSCSGTPGSNYSCSNVTLTAATPYATTGWRLPTEADWEYAYRAGTTTPWYFGSDSNLLGTYAWFSSNSGNTTHPVAQKQPNAWGLYDMAGNVWEWCWDWYASSYPGTVTDPTGPVSGSSRVIRGGAWLYVASNTRAATRLYGRPDNRNDIVGFRLVRSRP